MFLDTVVERWRDDAAEWRLGSASSTYAHITALLSRADQRALAAVYGLAALVSLFIAGEEISWGQRVLGFATPAGLDDINDQGKTNLHNIGIVVKVFNLVVLTICAAAIVLPILRWTWWRGTARTVAGYVLIPSLALLPAFAFPFLHRPRSPARRRCQGHEVCGVRGGESLLRAGRLRTTGAAGADPRVDAARGGQRARCAAEGGRRTVLSAVF